MTTSEEKSTLGIAGVDAAADLAPGGGEPLLPLPALAARGAGSSGLRRVDLGGHHDDRAAQVPAEGRRVLGDVLLVAGARRKQVAQEVALVLVLDRGRPPARG